uniref:Sulfatase-modifying factor enzyme-like domain-containing protein n=1 Tax=Chlorobium chlorochromatii (strain CaD3) TaxID=340177 RepID=Q3APX8_CHLCH
MEKIAEELLKLIPFSKLFELFGLSKEISLALSTIFSIGIVALLWYGVKMIYLRFQIAINAKDIKPYFNNANDIEKKLSLFIETWGQDKLPAREEEPIYTHESALNKSRLISHFIKKVFSADKSGEKFFLVLGDSGMGKTTFMVNLYVRCQSFINFRRKNKVKVKFFPFGYKGEILDKIKEIPQDEKINTILLLDAFDEYYKLLPPDIPDGLSDDKRFRKVLDEVIDVVQDFRKVVITGRTQYFPGEDDKSYILEIPTFDDNGFHKLNKFYISPFTEDDIRHYLYKKYGYIRFWNFKKREKALKLIFENLKETKFLLVRPMLLSYIDLFVNSNQIYKNIWDIYEALINEWIEREGNKRKHDSIACQQLKENLHNYSQKIAVTIYENRKGMQIVSLTKEEATENINDALKHYEVTGQSLLTRDAENKWKFAHRSILEFFIAKEAVKNQEFANKLDVTNLDMAKKFCIEKGLGYLFDYVPIKGGEFTMGSPDGEVDRSSTETQHQVKLHNFYIAKYVVTVAEFRKFIEECGYKTDAEKANSSRIWTGKEWKYKAGVNWRCGVGGQLRLQNEENHPVIHVSWNDAKAYCDWLSKKTGKKYRLPTEAEWEYACRAGTTTPFNTGDNLTTAQANYDGNYPYNGNAKGKYRQTTVPVDSFAPNAWGLYNMHGNVWEWCSDWYNDKYYEVCKAKGVVENPECTEEQSYRVLRGGSWGNDARSCRSAIRNLLRPRPPLQQRWLPPGFRPVASGVAHSTCF